MHAAISLVLLLVTVCVLLIITVDFFFPSVSFSFIKIFLYGWILPVDLSFSLDIAASNTRRDGSFCTTIYTYYIK